MTGVGATLTVLALLYNISNSPCLFKELSKLNCKLFSLMLLNMWLNMVYSVNLFIHFKWMLTFFNGLSGCSNGILTLKTVYSFIFLLPCPNFLQCLLPALQLWWCYESDNSSVALQGREKWVAMKEAQQHKHRLVLSWAPGEVWPFTPLKSFSSVCGSICHPIGTVSALP